MNRQRHLVFMLFCVCISLLVVIDFTGKRIAFGAADTQTSAMLAQPSKFQTIHMVDGHTGWAILGDESYTGVFRTQDGGETWINAAPSSLQNDTASSIFGHFFLDGSSAWLMTGDLWYTRDGGHSWQKSATRFTGDGVIALEFSDTTHGWLLMTNGGAQNATFAILYQTTDGGESWQPIADDGVNHAGGRTPISPVQSGVSDESPTGMAFASARSGWLTLSFAPNSDSFDVLRQTTDGGKTWQAVNTPPVPNADLQACDLSGLQAYPPTSFTFLANCQRGNYLKNPQVFLYTISADGQHWQRLQLPSRVIVADDTTPQVFMLNATTGWLIGNDAKTGPLCCGNAYDAPALYQTIDTGKTWTRIGPLPAVLKATPGKGVLPLKFDFVDDHTGWVITTAGDLLTTRDAGKTWSMLTPVITAP